MGIADARQNRRARRQARNIANRHRALRAGRRHDSRQRGARQLKQTQQLIVPAAAVQTIELRARGVGVIGNEHLARAELPGKPAVDGADAEFARRRARRAVRDRRQHAGKLRRREHRIHRQPGQSGNARGVARGAQIAAKRFRAPILPAHQRRERLAVAPLPDQHRLALIADRHRRYRRAAALRQAVGYRLLHRLPDSQRVLLRQPRLRMRQRQRLTAARHDAALAIDGDRLGIGGAFVNRQNKGVFHGQAPAQMRTALLTTLAASMP